MKCRLTEPGWIREGEGLWICLTLVFAGTPDGAMPLLEARGADRRRRVVPGAVLCCCCMEEQVVASLLQRARPNLITITASFKEPFQNQTNTALKASILAQGGPQTTLQSVADVLSTLSTMALMSPAIPQVPLTPLLTCLLASPPTT